MKRVHQTRHPCFKNSDRMWGLQTSAVGPRSIISLPTRIPRSIGTFSSNPHVAHLKRASTEPSPEIDPLFRFHHADLGPTKIMIADDGNVVTIMMDWESGAYYPRFCITAKPVVSSLYWLDSFRPIYGVSSWGKRSRRKVLSRRVNSSPWIFSKEFTLLNLLPYMQPLLFLSKVQRGPFTIADRQPKYFVKMQTQVQPWGWGEKGSCSFYIE